MYEMIAGRPLFPGATVEDELHLIFRTLGPPTELTWPGIESVPEFADYRTVQHVPESLLIKAPRLAQDSALSLLNKFLLVSVIAVYDSLVLGMSWFEKKIDFFFAWFGKKKIEFFFAWFEKKKKKFLLVSVIALLLCNNNNNNNNNNNIYLAKQYVEYNIHKHSLHCLPGNAVLN